MSQVVAISKEGQPFVGREKEQKEYWDFLAGKSDDSWLLVISGLGGIGKSMLLNKLYQQTLEQHTLPDTFAILLNFDTSTNTEPPLQTSSSQPDASLRTDPLLFLNELAHLLKPHSDAQQFNAFTVTLQKGRSQLAQFKEQVEQSSQSFAREHSMQIPPDARQKIRFAELEVDRQVRELVTEAFYRQAETFQPGRLVIMLDTCELLSESESWIFSQWLMNEFLPELRSRMWRKTCFVVMAGRIVPKSEVIDENDQQHIVLSMLEESAVDSYLEKMGVSDPTLRHSVYKITRGHALCVAIIGQFYQNIGQEALQAIDTSVLQTEFDEHASLELINKRILNNLDNPFRDLTQFGVLLRTFTLPLLRTIFSDLLPEADAKAMFDQFIRYPYIESRGNYRYAFHELIRDVLAKNTQKNDLERWRQYHKKALDYFSVDGISSRSMDWYYHNLAYEEVQGMSDWRKAVQEARDRGDIQRVSSLLQITDDVALNLTTLSRAECAYEWGRLNVDRRQPFDKALEKYEEARRLYDQVGDHPEEVRRGQANVLQAMGDVQQSKLQLEQALHSYQSTLDLLQRFEMRSMEVEAQVLKKIGDVHQLRGNLDDLNSALESYKQALDFFLQVGDSLQAAQILKDMGDVQQQRYRLRLEHLEDLNTALENYEQAFILFRQAKHRSQEDEAQVLEAIGNIYWLRYKSSQIKNHHDLEVATEKYRQAFGLFSDDTNARKRLKERVEPQEVPQEEPLPVKIVRQKAPHTGTYGAALIATSSVVPVVASFISVVFFIAFPQSLWPRLIAPLSGTALTLLAWLILAVPFIRFTAVDLANASSYESLLNRLSQLESWFKILEPEPQPKSNSLYAISKQEVRYSCDSVYEGLTKKGLSWVLATGYVTMWKLMHRADEAFINIEPVEAVIHSALHDEMRLQNLTLTNKEDLLKKLRKAVKQLDKRAATYLNEQPPQEEETESEQSSDQSTVDPQDQSDRFSDDINIRIQARTIIREVRYALHQFRDDRWEKLVRVRNHLVRMTMLAGIALYILLEFAILAGADVQMIIAATVFYLVGAIVGLFSRLYEQAKSDTSIDDFNLAAVRLLAAQLYSGIAAIGGVVIVQRAILASTNLFNLNLSNILVAAVFGLTPSLFTNAIQKEAEQYKTDLKSTAAPMTTNVITMSSQDR